MMNVAASQEGSCDASMALVTQTAVIKGFEYSYEMAVKTLKRFIEEASAENDARPETSFRDILRDGYEYGLISSVEAWFVYRDKRNKTSHAYADEIAKDVLAVVPAFVKDATILLRNLEIKAKEVL